jgi:hypothetical protein
MERAVRRRARLEETVVDHLGCQAALKVEQ